LVDQRAEVGALVAADPDLGRDDKLFLGRDRLSRVALQEPARGLDRSRVRIGQG
jgi:hypothetical protein